MSARLPMVYRFRNEVGPMTESMLVAGKALQVPSGPKWLAGLISVATFLLMAMGGATAATAIAFSLGLPSEPFFWPGILGAFLGFWLFTGWYNRLIRLMAGGVLDTPFNQGEHEIRFDAQGVTLTTPQASWLTRWPAIHDVQAGREGLHILLSGIALCVPRSALDGTPEEVLERLRAFGDAEE